ncbi:MAG: hypothetical protein IJW00_10140, partial [Clostridia bacterium]|nr:hypothetical protein [Clostridia bacterium]
PLGEVSRFMRDGEGSLGGNSRFYPLTRPSHSLGGSSPKGRALHRASSSKQQFISLLLQTILRMVSYKKREKFSKNLSLF